MGNTAISESCSNFCRFNFLPHKVLAQSSLHPVAFRKSVDGLSTISYHESKSPSPKSNGEKKDSPDSPDLRYSCHLPKPGKPKELVNENDFHILKFLGTTDCGRAYLVKKDDDQKLYTMKTVSKKKAYSLGCVDSLYFEKELLKKANHPFLPKLEYTFENDKRVFFVFDYVKSEELHTVLQHLTRFSEEITKFYSAEILLALEYLHKEIKATYELNTRNILFDSEGHIKLASFARSRTLDFDHAGKHEISRRETLDFKDFGYLIFELLTGYEPMEPVDSAEPARDKNTTKSKIHWPKYISKNARDLITRLLISKVDERPGYNSFDEIKCHPFFDGIQWKKLQKKLIYPPINPSCHNCKTHDSAEAVDLSNSSEEACELDQIVTKKPRDIVPNIIEAESFDHCHPHFNRLED